MKSSNRSSLITGIALLAIAAIFSISLVLQLLDFGVGGPGHNNLFYVLGNMLYSVYGFSSILIPVFLLVAGLSCFATKWTARKSMRLLTAIIPFFTAVITENICRSILKLGTDSFSGLKITIAIVTGIMLIVIEFLGIGILADKVNAKIYEKQGKTVPRKKITTNVKEETVSDEPEIKTSTVFDDALAEVGLSESKNQITDEENDNGDRPLDEKIEFEEEKNPTSVITQDEYAALISQDSTEDETVDEITWDNVPPAPASLPPEYTEEIVDENDPSLDFPPVDASDDSINPFEDAFVEDDKGDRPLDSEVEEISSDEIIYEEAGDFEETQDTSEYDLTYADDEENPYAAANYIDSIMEDSQDADEIEKTQSVIPEIHNRPSYNSPAYPTGISLGDESEEFEEEEEKKTVNKSQFPARIRLNDELDAEIDAFEENDIAEEVDYERPVFQQIAEKNDEPEFSEIPQEENEADDLKIDDTFFDIDMNDNEAVDEAINSTEEENETMETMGTDPSASKIKNDFTSPVDHLLEATRSKSETPKPGFSSSVSSVFSDMENDIRSNMPEIEEDFEDITEGTDLSAPEVNVDGTIEDYSEPSLEKPSATNLTKDELSDFFNAQQAENTPVGQEIVSTRPKTHRAEKKGPYSIPSNLLTAYKDDEYWIIDDATKQASMNLKQTLSEFNIEADIIGIKKGPVVTMFEILPAPGVKLSKIVALQDNIALSLAAQSVRIVAPIPGKQAVGIEVPNKHRSIVGFREIIEMNLDEWKKMAVPVVLGKDILGKAQLIDLVKTPHMLIAGATGSGKSVCVNSLILSILYKRSYKDVKLILVDPKVVELKLYNNIPHLLTPVITEPKKALQALQYCLCEMERRYALLDSMGVRDISNYNQKIRDQKIATEKLPYIVVIIDEFADLMATSGKELESIVARLTAMSRAVGIHLVLATQRPSVNVITGLIKANIPTRIAFMVASRTDSNIIIDSVGAEKLLGRGDMLYASAVDPAPIRIQGTFVSDQEVEDVVNAVKEYGEPDYIDDEIFVEEEEDVGGKDLFGNAMTDEDPLYDQALEIVVQAGKASASYLQRRLSIGYNRAARLVEVMEERGIVGPANGSKPREIIHIP